MASEIIEATLNGVKDYVNGRTINDLPLKNKMKEAIQKQLRMQNAKCKIKEVPVSVKTRIGYGDIVIEEWADHLTNHDIAALTVHGRTLNQMYSGEACWESIGKAAKIVKEKGIIAVGNGDVINRKDGEEKCKKYGLDGVLIGRATFGNPWVFDNHEPSVEERIEIAKYHSRKFEELYGTDHFYVMRKFLAWYVKGVAGAKEFRKELMLVNSYGDVEKVLEKVLID